ncbi:MAG: hypothetical protein WCI76_02325 [bacterium]
MKYNAIQKNKGFTIIETMIATSLFIIIVTAGLGALLNASLLHQKSRDMRSILDNLSFVMEDMSRNLRTGYNYHCFISGDVIPSATSSIVSTPKSCANGWAISFESASGVPSNNDDQWLYYIGNTGKIFKSNAGPYVSTSFVQITPDEVVVNTSKSGFTVTGAEGPASGDTLQPFVTIKLNGIITSQGIVTPFSLQTSVSQRNIDI